MPKVCNIVGGVCSPILSNIYLDKLDKFVETVLMPKYNRGERREPNPAYQRIKNAIDRAKRRGDRQALRQLRKQRRKLPSQDPQDPGYRRLHYVRYADDWLLGFSVMYHQKRTFCQASKKTDLKKSSC
jgi:hypothetical protein